MIENNAVTSEPATTPAAKSAKKKRKMSAAARKAISESAKARWAAKQASLPADVDRVEYYRQNNDGAYSLLNGNVDVGQAAVLQQPAPPSPAVLQLQAQVVDMVSQRGDARSRLTIAHGEYLAAQSRFQAAQAELQGIEQEVQYRINLIAQLENRQPANVYNFLAPEIPASTMQGVTSEPAPRQTMRFGGVEAAVGHADRSFVNGAM